MQLGGKVDTKGLDPGIDFKEKSSTMHATYCLKETINYYVENGNRVFCALIDA